MEPAADGRGDLYQQVDGGVFYVPQWSPPLMGGVTRFGMLAQ